MDLEIIKNIIGVALFIAVIYKYLRNSVIKTIVSCFMLLFGFALISNDWAAISLSPSVPEIRLIALRLFENNDEYITQTSHAVSERVHSGNVNPPIRELASTIEAQIQAIDSSPPNEYTEVVVMGPTAGANIMDIFNMLNE